MSDPGTSGRRSEKDIFFDALEKNTPEERAAFLDGACGTNPAQRAKVEALLADHFQQDAFMKELAVDSSAPSLPAPPPSEAPAQILGRYKLLEKIGEGGFGEVWMAEQREPVKRRVALKIIKLGMDSRQIVARFEAERQALAMMDHPNIAKIFDAGTTGAPLTQEPDRSRSVLSAGRPYFVMELVRGIKITEYCDQNQLPTQERLRLFIQVCQAIQHAHQKGIIHRDIKPSNILVTLHDGVPVPKVIDFGIAKATQQELTDKTVFTQFQQFIGTPAYISPEQAEMSGLDIDTRADIYSLGVLLYELLVGQTPFDAKEMMQGGLDALRQIIREKEPLRPSTKLNTLPGEARTTAGKRRQTDVGKLVHQLQGDLDWIVMKCLEKDRTRRYDTANGLASDIQRHLNDEPVVARPASAAYRVQKAFRRNKLAFSAGLAVATALLVGITASLWQAARATRAKIQADASSQAAQDSEQNAKKAEAGQSLLREQAEIHELAARRRAYASDMSLAQQSLASDNLGRALELLNRQRPGKESEIDLRGWEWRYLWKQCRSDASFTFCQRSNAIFSLAVSHDGKWLAIGEEEQGGISIWDLAARRQVAEFSAGDARVLVAFSPRESLLAFCGGADFGSTNRQDRVRLWDATTQKIIAELPVEGGCRGLAFSQDGQTLVGSSAGWDGGPTELTLWRIPEGRRLIAYSAPQVGVGKPNGIPFALASDMSVVAHGMLGGRIRVVDLANGRERWTAQAVDRGYVESLALSPNGKILASSSGITETAIRLWEVDSGKEIGRLEGHRAYVIGLTFWPDGTTLASASADQTIRLWDVADVTHLRPLGVLRGHRLEVWGLAMLADNTTLVSGCKDGSVYVWDTRATRRERSGLILPAHISRSHFWRFTADSRAILTCDVDGLLARWQGDNFQEMQPVLQLGPNIIGACISEDRQVVATGSTNGVIRLWELQQRAMVGEFVASTGSVFPHTFLAQGKRLLAGSPGEMSVSEWDLTTGQKLQSWRFPAASRAALLSPDERWWLTLDWNGSGLIRDLATGRDTSADMQVRQVYGVAFSPDSKLIAAASGLGFARLFDFEGNTPRELATLRGFLLGVHSVAFSSDGKRLATSSSGKEAIKVWDVASHQELLTLEGQSGVFRDTRFSPDGNVLGSASSSGLLQLWRAPSWEEIATAEAKEKTETKNP